MVKKPTLMYKIINGLIIINTNSINEVFDSVLKSDQSVKVICNNKLLSENDIEKLILTETKSFSKMLQIYNHFNIKIIL